MRSSIGTLPRVGFVGVDWIGSSRLDAVVREGVAEVVTTADPPVSELEGIDCNDAFDELLERELDGIVIATPNAFHAEQSIAALRHGLAVYCQKPLGRTADEARRVVEAAREADRLLLVGLCYRDVEAFREARALVLDGEIGDVFAADLVFHNAHGPDKPWFYDPELSGGGCVMDPGVHLLDLALWTLDFPEVTNVSSRLFGVGEVEDYAVAQLDLAGGAVVRLACSWNLHAGQDAVVEATYYGARGSVSARNIEGSFSDFRCEVRYRTRTDVLAEPPDDWSGRGIAEWALRLGRGDGFDEDAEHVVEVSEIVDRIYDAAECSPGKRRAAQPRSSSSSCAT